MKPQDRIHQTATQVKVLSPVMVHVIEADCFHMQEGNKMQFVIARTVSLTRGLSPWYGEEGKSQKLGRSKQLFRKRVFTANLKKKESENGCLEVGLLRSRGVIGVTPYEDSSAYSKGAAIVCRGEVKHDPYKEMD